MCTCAVGVHFCLVIDSRDFCVSSQLTALFPECYFYLYLDSSVLACVLFHRMFFSFS